MAFLTHTKEQIQAMRTKPQVRWHADAEGNVYDADFKFDAMLKINGDFGSNIRKQEYAAAVAAALNAYWPDADAGPRYESVMSVVGAAILFFNHIQKHGEVCTRDAAFDAFRNALLDWRDSPLPESGK